MVKLESGYVLDGQYKIISLIAIGGMSSIYRAECIKDGNVAAIKVPHEEMDIKQSSIQRFNHGCQISLMIAHPNVCKFLPVDHSKSRLYAVMEYIEGRTVRDILKRIGKLPVSKAVNIAIQVCDALSFIHEKKIYHQDIKPGNIFVLKDDSIKLIDFGLAYCPKLPDIPWADLLSVGGTPDYLAPERIDGINDPRSDIYSLGITLYEMIVGSTPFYGGTLKDVVNAHLRLDPPHPRDVAPNTKISKKLDKAILKALRKSPRERYHTALEFKNDLEDCQESTTWEKINWFTVIIGILTGILLLIIFLLTKTIWTTF